MRQTLFRVVPEFWEYRSAGNQLYLGAGYLLVLFLAYAVATACWRLIRGGKPEPLGISWFTVLGLAAALFMLPRMFDGGVPVYGYGFMLFIGFMAAGKSAEGRARCVGLDKDIVWDLGMWIFFGGIIGARIFYLVQYGWRIFPGLNPREALIAAMNLSDGGLVFYGGVILGAIGYMYFCHRRQISPLLMGDIAMPSVFIGLAFGRGGCFLNGCCFGDRCDFPWAVHFPQGSVPFVALVNRGFQDPLAAASLPLHPTQIYSVVNALVLAFLTSVYFRYRPRPGSVLAVGFVLYPLSRMVIELLRGDEMGQFGTGLTISQWVSILLSAMSLLFLAYLLQQSRHPRNATP